VADNNLDSLYTQYAETFAEKTALDSKLRNLGRLVDDLKKDIKEQDSVGGCGLDVTAHASKQILKRLESLASESSSIYKDVMNLDNPTASLIWPTNMESFVIGMLAKAREKKEFTIESSKNSNGKEYHYNIEIKTWSTDLKRLIFTGVVEGNNVKTGFFNWAQ
jgi:hypothetical protein